MIPFLTQFQCKFHVSCNTSFSLSWVNYLYIYSIFIRLSNGIITVKKVSECLLDIIDICIIEKKTNTGV